MVRSTSGRGYRGIVWVYCGHGGRDGGSQLGGMRVKHVVQYRDPGVKIATGAAGLVYASAAICAVIRGTGCAASAPATVGRLAGPDVERRLPPMGLLRGQRVDTTLIVPARQ